MKMVLKFAADAFVKALDRVSVVTPKPLVAQGASGFLCVVEGTTCTLYSRDTKHAAKAEFPLLESDGDGSFVFPSDSVAGFRYFGTDDVTLVVTEEEGAWKLAYTTHAGASMELPSLDPKLVTPFDKDLKQASDPIEFPIGILKEAIQASRGFLPKTNDSKIKECFKSLQIFDGKPEELKKANGTLYAANMQQALYWTCQGFMDKELVVYGDHIPLLLSFISKAEGIVTFRQGASTTYAVDSQGAAFGWVHQQEKHTRFSYYALSSDQFEITVSRANVLDALKYLQTEIGKDDDIIKLVWNNNDSTFVFEIQGKKKTGKSFPVPGVRKKETEGHEDLSAKVSLTQLLMLFEGLKSHEASLRMCVTPPKEGGKSGVLLRTIEEFLMDVHGKVVVGDPATPKEGQYPCRVTRFMPGRV